MPAIAAKARAKLALQATTALTPEAVLEIVKQATSEAKGGGLGTLTTGVIGGVSALSTVGATVHIEKQTANRLEMSITSGKRVVELCTLTAEVSPTDGGSQLRVGPLGRYKTQQPKALGFIPIGPTVIYGYDLYKRFLDQVEQKLAAADATATITVALPESVAK